MLTIDILKGTRSLRLDLGAVPFLSSLGPNEGELEIALDPTGHVADLKVSQVSARRNLLRELDRLAADADWQVPVEAIRASAAPRFTIDLELSAAASERLLAAQIAGEQESLEELLRKLRPLLKEAHFRLANVREVHSF